MKLKTVSLISGYAISFLLLCSALPGCQKDINSVQKNLSTYEKVRRFTLLEKPFTIEENEMTPTLKIKRRVIDEKYKDVIDKIYLDAEKEKSAN